MILDAVDLGFFSHSGRTLSLEAVAQGADTTVQTVLRHFGSKAGLFEAAARRGFERVKSGRDEVPAGDLEAVVAYLARHYEEMGPMVLRMLAVEHEVPEVMRIVRRGRQLHRAWVARVLAPLLKRSERHERRLGLRR